MDLALAYGNALLSDPAFILSPDALSLASLLVLMSPVERRRAHSNSRYGIDIASGSEREYRRVQPPNIRVKVCSLCHHGLDQVSEVKI